jgi:hypothetical protein
MEADNIRKNIIDKLLTISNKEYLSALYQLVQNSSIDNYIVKLSKEQILMLELSEDDIKNGRILTQEQMIKNDLKWLEELSLN